MAFRKIEYLLIAAFLVLNVFLVFVFVGKNALLFSSPIDQSRVDVQQEMRDNDIQFMTPEDKVREEPFIRALMQEFNEKDIEPLAENTYDIDLSNRSRLIGTLNDPLTLKQINNDTQAKNLSDDALKPLDDWIGEHVYQGNQYRFAAYDNNQRMITYMQESRTDLPIVDGTGELVFNLNDDYNVEMFNQTYAGETKAQGEKRQLVSEKQALENLYLNNKIQKGDKVVYEFLGYYQTLKVDKMKIYNPTWVFFIQNGDGVFERLHVDGVNGTIVQDKVS